MSGNRRMGLTDAASEEITRLEKRFGLTAPQLIRRSTLMLRRYVEAKRKGYELKMVNPGQPQSDFVLVEMPIQILEIVDLDPGEKIKQVWKAFKQNPSNQALRNQLIEQFLPLVRHQAGRLWNRLPDNVDINDLISAGVFGLMDAIDKYDLTRGNKFETYCALRIRGAMLDEIRKMDWVPRLVRGRASKLRAARQAFEEEHGRPPTDEEVAAKLEMPLSEFNRFKGDATAVGLMSLNKEWFETDSHKKISVGDLLKDTKGEDPTKNIQNRDLMQLVTRGFNRHERLLVILYYYENLTMKQVGLSLGVSESRVSQMHTTILRRLKDQLSGRRSEFV